MSEKVKVDMTGAQKELELMPTGLYPCQITEVEHRVSENSGFPYLNVTLEVTDGDYVGRKLWQIVPLPDSGREDKGQKACLRSTGKFLEAVGQDVEDGDLDLESYIGLFVKANVVKETYEGEERNKVRGIVA